MKKILMIIAAFAAISAVSVNAVAASTPRYDSSYTVSPYYETASATTSTLTFSGTTAKCESKVIGHSNVTSCKVEQTLEKYSGWFWIWNDVDGASWSNIISGSSGKVTNSKSGLESGTYRLKSVFTLTTSSCETETITVYSVEKSIG